MFMHRIKLENILSFGPEAQELELRPLNVLIGPNGSGKSNLIEVIGLLRAAPSDIMAPIREGGGGENWMWRGERKVKEARVEVVVARPSLSVRQQEAASLLLQLDSPFLLGIPSLQEEIGEVGETDRGDDSSERLCGASSRKVTVTYRDESGKRNQRQLDPTDIESDQSILSQLKDPAQYRELTSLGMGLAGIRLYREWSLGRNTPPRLPQKADLPNSFALGRRSEPWHGTEPSRGDSDAKKKFLAALRMLYHGIDDYFVQVEAGSVQVFLREGNVPIPATRLSDGTLRYLCLLAVLCNPDLPRLVCIEEPELGLHPDILPSLADLLRETSERCQLIVTTHSDILVDALTETPESIVICEKENGQTKLKRLEQGRALPLA